jgi:hypothetical protein
MEIFVAELNGRDKTEAGRELAHSVACEIFAADDTHIEIKNKKPFFPNADLHFSISHSHDFVAVCFDSEPVGFDMEYMRERDFAGLLKRYEISAGKNAKETFYKFWCEYEAKVKLQSLAKSTRVFEIFDNYMCAVASGREEIGEIKITR